MTNNKVILPSNIEYNKQWLNNCKQWLNKGGKIKCRSTNSDLWVACDEPAWADGFEYMPETYGLSIGMIIPEKVISGWHKIKGESFFKTHCNYNELVSDKTIHSFDIVNGKCVFTATSVNYEIQLFAEDFLDFWKSFESDKEEEAPKELPLSKWLYGELMSGRNFIVKYRKDDGFRLNDIECFDSEGFNLSDKNNYVPKENIKRTATKEDIESIFAVVLEKMGYGEGVKVKDIYGGDRTHFLGNDKIYYSDSSTSCIIVRGGIVIYRDGVFATIVQPAHPVIESEKDMFTQEELKGILECVEYFKSKSTDDFTGDDVISKIKSLIQPELEFPLLSVGSRYEFEGILGYFVGYDYNITEARFSHTYIEHQSVSGIDFTVLKEDFNKLVLLKPYIQNEK